MNSEELKELGWNIYRCNNWRARHRETGKLITAGTHCALLSLVNSYEEMKTQPWAHMFK